MTTFSIFLRLVIASNHFKFFTQHGKEKWPNNYIKKHRTPSGISRRLKMSEKKEGEVCICYLVEKKTISERNAVIHCRI